MSRWLQALRFTRVPAGISGGGGRMHAVARRGRVADRRRRLMLARPRPPDAALDARQGHRRQGARAVAAADRRNASPRAPSAAARGAGLSRATACRSMTTPSTASASALDAQTVLCCTTTSPSCCRCRDLRRLRRLAPGARGRCCSMFTTPSSSSASATTAGPGARAGSAAAGRLGDEPSRKKARIRRDRASWRSCAASTHAAGQRAARRRQPDVAPRHHRRQLAVPVGARRDRDRLGDAVVGATSTPEGRRRAPGPGHHHRPAQRCWKRGCSTGRWCR